MSSIPTIPGIPQASMGGSIGPQGISFNASLTLDKCNARPIFVYVVPGEGNIWRIVDPLSPTEKLPVMKEWTEEVKYTVKIPGKVTIEQIRRTIPGTPGSTTVEILIVILVQTLDDNTAHFDFDERTVIAGDDQKQSLAQKLQEFPDAQILIFGHADRCHHRGYVAGTAPSGLCIPQETPSQAAETSSAAAGSNRGYNQRLSMDRADATETVMLRNNPHVTAGPRSAFKRIGCSNYCPLNLTDGERINRGNPRPGQQANEGGSPENRRSEIFVLPNFPKFEEFLGTDSVMQSLKAEVNASGGSWSDVFPCPTRGEGRKNCNILAKTNPGQSPHVTANPDAPGQPHCRFYERFKQIHFEQIKVTIEGRQTQQPGTPDQTVIDEVVHREPDREETRTDVSGEYHPPVGEHYGYDMNKMVGPPAVTNAGPLLAPEVATAPNQKVDPDDFNLIQTGPIQVVKMDLGFWGDERKKDLSRRSGFRRVPARYFGMIEGQFVFLCFFETPDNAGFVKECSDVFDENLTPLSARLAQAVRDAGFRILIMAKAVAEDGPNAQRLHVMFPDMHLPRKFDERDPVYSSDECLHRAHMVKSMVLQQLKRDYRLPAIQTPWLSNEDRQMCRDFFERTPDAARPRTLKLPHWSSGRRMSNPFEPSGSGLDAFVDATKKAYQALTQVGYYMFEFNDDDLRRMVKKYSDDFPEIGYGRTKDALFNWFYGFETDRNNPPPQRTGIEEEAKSMVPRIVAEGLDEWAGTSLSPDPGTKPAQESYDRVDALPARDLLRFLNVIGQQNRQAGNYVQVFQTGDLYELWANRRFLFEDFDFTNDPSAQMPKIAKSIMPEKVTSFGSAVAETLKFAARNFLKLMLGGINAVETDLWFRREANQRAPQGPMGPESSFTLEGVDNDFSFPEFSGPGTPGAVGISADNMRTPTVRYRNPRNMMFERDTERGKGYLSSETRQRMQAVADFEAPLRDGDDAAREDAALLGNANIRRRRNQPPMGQWNRAIIQRFARLRSTFVYGNHDCFRGNPRQGGIGEALPFYSVPGLWVEHGHRFEDSNLDGQPFGAFLTNLAFEIQELSFGEGLLDEFALHREQDLFQPGVLQWFILTEFGLDTLPVFQDPPKGKRPQDVPKHHRFRITVNSHTHVPDLVIANFVFKERESTNLFSLPLVGNVGLQNVINEGGALLKGILFHKQLVEWYERWRDRHGFDKWAQDIMGSTINWGVDFGGLASCVNKAADYIKKNAEDVRNRLESEWDKSRRTGRQAIDDNFRSLGLPPP